MDDGFDQVLVLGGADSVFALGETVTRRGGAMRRASLVCVIHRGSSGEFTHLYRVPAIPAGGRREVELLGVWPGVALRHASDRAAGILAVAGAARAAERPVPALREAA